MTQTEQPILWAGVLVIKDRRVLVLKETDKPFYIMPGGKLEPGETDEEAAFRETLEEVGVACKLSTFYKDVLERSRSTGKLLRFRLYHAELEQAPRPELLPERTEDFTWVNSQYKKEGVDVGNLLVKVLPLLAEQGLID